MVKTHALMESVPASLHQFLHSIDADLTKPQKKFLRDGVVGLLRAGRPIVCGMARTLPDQRGNRGDAPVTGGEVWTCLPAGR